jgi:hypothetical protein
MHNIPRGIQISSSTNPTTNFAAIALTVLDAAYIEDSVVFLCLTAWRGSIKMYHAYRRVVWDPNRQLRLCRYDFKEIGIDWKTVMFNRV